MPDRDNGPGPAGPPQTVLLVEIVRGQKGELTVRSPHLNFEGIEAILLQAQALIGRKLLAAEVLRTLAESAPRILPAGGSRPEFR